MGAYDHRRHVGNAGDVWKHFLLSEAAGFLMDSSRGSAAAPGLVYLESHAGRPDYTLRAPGEWQGGIGRILPLISLHGGLRDFSYFDILADLNSNRSDDTITYPGSGRLICELAKKKKASLSAHLWDNDHDVAESWNCFLGQADHCRPSPPIQISFQEGDGFSGVVPWLQSSSSSSYSSSSSSSSLSSPFSPFSPGLLFIDPPYVDPNDEPWARSLLKRASSQGWTILWWYMTELRTMPRLSGDRDLAALELQFEEAGLDGGKWKGSAVALAGPQRNANGSIGMGEAEAGRFDRLIAHLEHQRKRLIRMLKSV